MSEQTLSQLCIFIKDGTHGSPLRTSRGAPVLSARNVRDGRLSFKTDRFTDEKELALFQKRLHPKPGDVLLTIVGSIGRTALITKDLPLVFQRSVCVLRPDPRQIDSRFLRYALESDAVQSQLDVETHEVAQAGVYLESLNGIKINCPTLQDQDKITELLDTADRLHRQRRFAQTLSDSFLQSVFIKMFGDQRIERERFPLGIVKEVANIIVPTRDKPKKFTGNVPWITLPDVKELFIGTARNNLSHDEAATVGNRLMPEQTVLLSCAGSLGKIAIATREVYANQQFYGLVPKPGKCNSSFLALALITLGEDFFFRIAGISTLGFFSRDKALNIEIPIPPLLLQEKFAAMVQKFERVRRQQREATRQAEHLFQTLLHRAFSGRL